MIFIYHFIFFAMWFAYKISDGHKKAQLENCYETDKLHEKL